MADDGGSVRVQVFGADPAHAEREARELRDVLGRVEGVATRFADRRQPGAGPQGSKGGALTPEVVLLVSGSSATALRAVIKGWVEVRKSRYARVEFSDGSVAELRGGVSGRELNQLLDRDREQPPEEVLP
ncbi:effector-associated constant component EACC1 [Saccharothrix sp. ST-888]|uniref:effector-associated constant component EACC1 n=1 Tax=Saccharothrix sp. ST-888 TaxID=1427391 RepID=UPI000B18FD5F|nr:hypothetical protein [Saccharothrix sp. ST-888]